MKVLFVCGGRDRKVESQTLIRILLDGGYDYIMHGNAKHGIDAIAHLAGLKAGVQTIACDYINKLGRAGGPVRNRNMAVLLRALADSGWEVRCMAYPGTGTGTRGMIKELGKVKLSVEVYE